MNYAKKLYAKADFGKDFEQKAAIAEIRINTLKDNFALCAPLCKVDTKFMQSIVFPEVMRFNNIKDNIEAESLRTLYVQFGAEYANFSIGLFQMKPTFAEIVEKKAKILLSDSLYKELQLEYEVKDNEETRRERVNRLQDADWQMVYLTAFICICNETYKNKFNSELEKLQWYATIYNAGFDKSNKYIQQKILENNFYFSQNMPDKKFKYTAIVLWYYNKKN